MDAKSWPLFFNELRPVSKSGYCKVSYKRNCVSNNFWTIYGREFTYGYVISFNRSRRIEYREIEDLGSVSYLLRSGRRVPPINSSLTNRITGGGVMMTKHVEGVDRGHALEGLDRGVTIW